jgi:hypothetical protein
MAVIFFFFLNLYDRNMLLCQEYKTESQFGKILQSNEISGHRRKFFCETGLNLNEILPG